MAGSLRKLFTNEEVLNAIDSSKGNYVKASEKLTKLGRGLISYQLVNYWHRQLTEVVKKNGDPYIGTTVLDRKIRKNEVKLRKPSPLDYVSKIEQSKTEDNSRILAFSCTHEPYVHPDALAFLAALEDHFNFTRVIHLGDETDGQALKFHDSDPNLDSAGHELAKARIGIEKLAKLFPVLEICHSNHGSLVYRRAKKYGIPAEMIKSYRDILFPNGGGEGWSWKNSIRLELPSGEELLLRHDKTGDILNSAAHERANEIRGHKHTTLKLDYRSSDACLYWGMYVGCMIDRKSSAFGYGDLHGNRPILGASVVINSLPIPMPMVLDKHGRWIGRLIGV